MRAKATFPATPSSPRRAGLVGARHVTLDRAAHTVRFDRRGVELDLGGIAKGYAVDRAVSILRQRGIPAALVSAGGSTRSMRWVHHPDEAHGMSRSPIRLNSQATALHVPLTDRALSVAGRSEKFFDAGGVRSSHHGPAHRQTRAGSAGCRRSH